jgi:hypothetical protein
VSGCAEEQGALVILHAPAWPDDGSCFVDPSTDTTLGGAVLDVSFGSPYLLPLVLQSRLQSRVGNAGIDTSQIQLRDADIELSLPQVPEIIEALRDESDALVEFTIPLPSNAIEAGERHGVAVEAISSPASWALAEQLSQGFPDQNVKLTVIVDVVVHALRSGNTAGTLGVIDSRTFSFPVSICSGCLISCAACEGGVCPTSEVMYSGGICGNAQDAPIFPSSCIPP